MSKSKLKTKLNSVEDTSHFFDGNSVVNNSYEENKIFQNVNHPDHYQSSSGLEVIDVIEDFNLGFCLGNVIKYVLRCGKKDAEI